MAAVRERTCPGCTAPVQERTARWCGRCGEPLAAVPVATPARGSPVRWRRAALGVVASMAAVGLVAAAGPVVDRLPSADTLAQEEVASPGDQALQRVGRRYLPPAAPLDEPVCLRAPGDECLLWHLEDERFPRAVVAVAGDTVVLAEQAGPALRGVGLRDGVERWTEPSPGSNQHVTTTEDLVLSVERWADDRAVSERLVVRDADTGATRFYLDGFSRDGWLQATQVGDRLLVVADDGSVDLLAGDQAGTGDGEDAADGEGADGAQAEAHNLALLGIDVGTGEVAWRTSARGTAGVAADGTSVVLEAGELVARDADGRERWRTTPAIPEAGGGWIHGGVVHVWRTDGRPDLLLRLSDGEPYPFGGGVLATSGRHSLLHVWDSTPSGGQASQRLVLLRDGEPAWESPLTSDCLHGARIEAGVVSITDCDGRTYDRDVTDGRELRDGPADEADVLGIGERIGPYLLRPESGDDPRSASVLVDTRSDHELLRLPPNASPIYTQGPEGWSADAGGVLLVQHNGGLTAIDLPSTDPGPAAMLRTFAR